MESERGQDRDALPVRGDERVERLLQLGPVGGHERVDEHERVGCRIRDAPDVRAPVRGAAQGRIGVGVRVDRAPAVETGKELDQLVGLCAAAHAQPSSTALRRWGGAFSQ